MSVDSVSTNDERDDESILAVAAASGDESAFSILTTWYRRQLQVHCYRILGSFEEAEEIVQETFLRAWRNRATFEGRSKYRTWLYRIATNACLDLLDRRGRRLLPPIVMPAGDPRADLPEAIEAVWLQPFPDLMLEPVAPEAERPDVVAVERETIELAFLVAIQVLPARQRAILILRDVLEWSAQESAALLETTVAAVNSALQRARETMRQEISPERQAWTRPVNVTKQERLVLNRYLDAHHRGDIQALATLLREDVRLSMPPIPVWFDGRADVVTFHAGVFSPEVGHIRGVATAANRQPAAALYVKLPGATDYQPLALDVLRVEGGKIVEITSFLEPELFPSFSLPMRLQETDT